MARNAGKKFKEQVIGGVVIVIDISQEAGETPNIKACREYPIAARNETIISSLCHGYVFM